MGDHVKEKKSELEGEGINGGLEGKKEERLGFVAFESYVATELVSHFHTVEISKVLYL